MNQQYPFWKPAMTYGLYLGIALVLIELLFSMITNGANTSGGMLTNIAMAAGIYYSQLQYRRVDLGGYITYGRSLKFGVAVMASASIILSFYLLILMKFINPELIDQVRIANEELWMQSGMSDDQIELMSEMYTTVLTPGMMAFSGLLGYSFIGFIISLITSFFVKKENEEMAFDEAMEDIKTED